MQGCGQTKTVSRSFWLGKPAGPVTTPSGTPSVKVSLGTFVTVRATTPGADISTLSWWTNSSNLSIASHGPGNVVVEAKSIGRYYLYVTSSNVCGTSAYQQIPFEVTNGGGGGPGGPGNPGDPPYPQVVTIYPNPTDKELFIELSDEQVQSTDTINTGANAKLLTQQPDHIERIDLINDQAQVVFTQDRIDTKKVKLNVDKLPAGRYFVQISYKKSIIQRQVLIE